MENVFSAVESICPYIKSGNLIIIESTCPVGTTEKAVKYLKKKRKDLIFPDSFEDNKHNVYIVYCPERVLPGNILFELQNNNRVLGGTSKKYVFDVPPSWLLMLLDMSQTNLGNEAM